MKLLKQYFYGCTESAVELVFLNKLLTCCATGSKILSIVFVWKTGILYSWRINA